MAVIKRRQELDQWWKMNEPLSYVNSIVSIVHSLVFPAASKPNIKILISLLPKIFERILPIITDINGIRIYA